MYVKGHNYDIQNKDHRKRIRHMYVCMYICRHKNVKHWPYAHQISPSVYVQQPRKNVLAWSMYVHTDMYINICCDVYYHVSGNENVEQWPYAQRLTLASVALVKVGFRGRELCTYVCHRAAPYAHHIYVHIQVCLYLQQPRKNNLLDLCEDM